MGFKRSDAQVCIGVQVILCCLRYMGRGTSIDGWGGELYCRGYVYWFCFATPFEASRESDRYGVGRESRVAPCPRCGRSL